MQKILLTSILVATFAIPLVLQGGRRPPSLKSIFVALSVFTAAYVFGLLYVLSHLS
jgi:hypothetical protein